MGKKGGIDNSKNNNNNNNNNSNYNKGKQNNVHHHHHHDNNKNLEKEKELKFKKDLNENQNFDDPDLIKRLFGFDDFNTTKNKNHNESDCFGVFKGSQVKCRFRQYMNRKKGFNKPLDGDK